MLLIKLKYIYRNPKSCICQKIREDSTFILVQVSSLLEEHYIKIRMDS